MYGVLFTGLIRLNLEPPFGVRKKTNNLGLLNGPYCRNSLSGFFATVGIVDFPKELGGLLVGVLYFEGWIQREGDG